MLTAVYADAPEMPLFNNAATDRAIVQHKNGYLLTLSNIRIYEAAQWDNFTDKKSACIVADFDCEYLGCYGAKDCAFRPSDIGVMLINKQ
jgi:hypothetical protein